MESLWASFHLTQEITMKAFPIMCAVLLSLSGGALLTPVYANEDPILLEDGRNLSTGMRR